MDGVRVRTTLALAALVFTIWISDAHARDNGGSVAGAPPTNLTGLYDVSIHNFVETNAIYHCIAYIDHDGGTNEIETLSSCYPDADLDDPNAEPRDPLPGEGSDGMQGLPPPPPYNWQAPDAGTGVYVPTPGNQSLSALTCYRNLGGVLGPNAIASTFIYLPLQQLDSTGEMTGQVAVYPRQGSAQCSSGTPSGTSIKPWEITLNPIDDVNGSGPNQLAPWRTLGDDDFDDDGCSDFDELSGTAGCGDDPFSALDLPSAGTDVSGNYKLVVAIDAADACWSGTYGAPPTSCGGGNGSIVPGVYHVCLLDVQQNGVALTARIYCYADSTAIAVNPQVAGGETCPPASAQYCGDGLAGAAPPGRTVEPSGQINFGDIDDEHAVLTGQLSAGRILLSGCLEDRDGMAALGHIHLSLDVDAHSGQGDATLSTDQALSNCFAGTPSGPPPPAAASLVRQATSAQQRDNDGDGCPDQRELSDARLLGGLRDPFNHYDYFNPTQDGINRVDDILAVVNQYFLDDPPGQPDYTSLTDRTGIMGANEWNLGPPNGLQRVDDILSSVKQYFHDC